MQTTVRAATRPSFTRGWDRASRSCLASSIRTATPRRVPLGGGWPGGTGRMPSRMWSSDAPPRTEMLSSADADSPPFYHFAVGTLSPARAFGTAVAVAVLLAAGCASAPNAPPAIASHTNSPPPGPALLVRRDLAERLIIPLAQVRIIRIEDRVWPDSCLGLPSPELCARQRTSGFRVTLDALGGRYVYHTDRGTSFRYAGPGDTPQRP
jgi:hypothetical protein